MSQVIPILARQNTMTRWYHCSYCGHDFQETTAVSMPPEKLKCPADVCGVKGYCTPSHK